MKDFKNVSIVTEGKQEYQAAVEFLCKMTGIEAYAPKITELSYVRDGVKNLVSHWNGKIHSWTPWNSETKPLIKGRRVLFSEIHTLLLTPKPIEEKVALSFDYEAVVTKKGIKVGCVLFSHESFDKLAEAVNKVRHAEDES